MGGILGTEWEEGMVERGDGAVLRERAVSSIGCGELCEKVR